MDRGQGRRGRVKRNRSGREKTRVVDAPYTTNNQTNKDREKSTERGSPTDLCHCLFPEGYVVRANRDPLQHRARVRLHDDTDRDRSQGRRVTQVRQVTGQMTCCASERRQQSYVQTARQISIGSGTTITESEDIENAKNVKLSLEKLPLTLQCTQTEINLE